MDGRDGRPPQVAAHNKLEIVIPSATNGVKA
jgi:hypothetical protein